MSIIFASFKFNFGPNMGWAWPNSAQACFCIFFQQFLVWLILLNNFIISGSSLPPKKCLSNRFHSIIFGRALFFLCQWWWFQIQISDDDTEHFYTFLWFLFDRDLNHQYVAGNPNFIIIIIVIFCLIIIMNINGQKVIKKKVLLKVKSTNYL